jgi:hypothetical protein
MTSTASGSAFRNAFSRRFLRKLRAEAGAESHHGGV